MSNSLIKQVYELKENIERKKDIIVEESTDKKSSEFEKMSFAFTADILTDIINDIEEIIKNNL